MQTLDSLLKYCKKMMVKYPSLQEDIIDFYLMARGEINDGGSVAHECDLAYNSIEELIEDLIAEHQNDVNRFRTT